MWNLNSRNEGRLGLGKVQRKDCGRTMGFTWMVKPQEPGCRSYVPHLTGPVMFMYVKVTDASPGWSTNMSAI